MKDYINKQSIGDTNQNQTLPGSLVEVQTGLLWQLLPALQQILLNNSSLVQSLMPAF